MDLIFNQDNLIFVELDIDILNKLNKVDLLTRKIEYI